MDVPRSMRKAGLSVRRLSSASVPVLQTGAVVTPMHRTRSIVETLIAAPVASAPAGDLLAPRAPMQPSPSLGVRKRSRGWSLIGRLAAVIGVGALFAWAVWPV